MEKQKTKVKLRAFFPLTIFEPFLNQVRVSGGLPAHLQLRVTSESTSTVFGWGSTNRIGPTVDKDRPRYEGRGKN